MINFIIKKNSYLNQDVKAFYHTDYLGRNKEGNPDYLNDLKNTFANFSSNKLEQAVNELEVVLKDFLQIISTTIIDNSLESYIICTVPRAKEENRYQSNQLLFKSTVKSIIRQFDNFIDGTDYIIRYTDTKTTHLSHTEYAGEGDMPYLGITKDTCYISNNIKDNKIILIDDIYTKGVNIDEDAIQALYDYGAKSVIFYAVAKT